MQLFRDFCEKTSIRGVRQIVSHERKVFRFYWFFFVMICFVLVSCVVYNCIVTYTNYRTVVQRESRTISGADFPSITACTNAFFGISPEIKVVMNHTESYIELMSDWFKNALKRNEFANLKYLLMLQTMVMYNINNYKAFQNIVYQYFDSLSLVEAVMLNNPESLLRSQTLMHCHFFISGTPQKCTMRPFYDLRYRNCLSFEVQSNYSAEIVNSIRLMIGLHDMKNFTSFPQYIILSNSIVNSEYLYIFLHHPKDLPRSTPDFSIPVRSNKMNTISFVPHKVVRFSTSLKPCISGKEIDMDHTNRTMQLQPYLMENLATRAAVHRNCNCEAWWPPLNPWPTDSKTFCGSIERTKQQALKDIECMAKFSPYTGSINTSHRLSKEVCTQYSYTSVLQMIEQSQKAFKRLTFEFTIYALSNELKKCQTHNITAHCEHVYTKLQALLSYNDYDFGSHNSSSNISKVPVPSVMSKYNLFPPLNAEYVTIKDSDIVSNLVFIDVISSAFYVSDGHETLVLSLQGAIGQIGGASSFLAGITFTVIAELLELIYRIVDERFNRRKEMKINHNGDVSPALNNETAPENFDLSHVIQTKVAEN